jgi:hypothetical protein
MNQGNTIVALVSVAACMVLALRALRARRVGFERTAVMVVAWTVIIAALAFILQRYTA